MKKIYAVINTTIIVLVIFWNYYSNTGAIDGKTVGEVSDNLYNLFTPAGYAFAIWGIIFLGLLALGINQIYMAFYGEDKSNSILKMGPWLSIANLANGTWLWFWLTEQTGISVLIMLVILFSLIQLILRLNLERWDAPAKEIALVWWPITIYSGWIAVATIANISAYLAKIGWSAVFTELQWTVIVICIAGILNLVMIYKRFMREFALVGVWALVAIAVRHWGEIPTIQFTALIWALVLFVASMVQGFKNRATNPFFKRLNS